MKVIATVPIYEINDVEQTGLKRPEITVESSSECSAFVVLVIEGTRFEVDADDLIEAVQRTTRV